MAEVNPITRKRNEGYGFYQKHEYDRAIEIFTELIEQNKDNVDLERYLERKYDWHFYRGLSYKDKNDNDAATKDFTEAMKLNDSISFAFQRMPENLKTPEWCLMAVKKMAIIFKKFQKI